MVLPHKVWALEMSPVSHTLEDSAGCDRIKIQNPTFLHFISAFFSVQIAVCVLLDGPRRYACHSCTTHWMLKTVRHGVAGNPLNMRCSQSLVDRVERANPKPKPTPKLTLKSKPDPPIPARKQL